MPPMMATKVIFDPPLLSVMARLKLFGESLENDVEDALERDVAKYYLRKIDMTFRNQGPNNLGHKWEALADTTLKRRVKGRGSKAKASAKILMDTGRMRQDIFPRMINKDTLEIYSGVDYSKAHHPKSLDGWGSEKNRSFMYSDKKDDEMVNKIMTEHVRKKVAALALALRAGIL